MSASDATAIVSRGWLGSVASGRGVWLPSSWTLAELAREGSQRGLSMIYVHDPTGWDGDTSGMVCTGDQGGAWRWRPEGDGTWPSVMMLGQDAGGLAGPWRGLSARQLLDALRVLEGLLEVTWGSSVGLTAERLILASHPRRRGGRLLDRDPYTPPPVAAGNLELDWQSWRRPLTDDERDLFKHSAGYVHVFDANAQHLAAWQAVELGHGQPRHVDRPTFDRSVVGFWRLEGLDKLATPATPLLPAPWLPGREWYSTPTIARMLEVTEGYAVPDVLEAFVWPERSRFLRGAGERLRDARAAAREQQTAAHEVIGKDSVNVDDLAAAVEQQVIADVVVDAVKALYSRQAGRFGMERSDGSGWARPDWGHLIRATARCNLHRRLAQLGAAPVAIATDALVFLTYQYDAAAFAQRIRLPLGDGLGQFKHDATVYAGEVDELEGDASAVRLMSAIRKART